MKRILITGATGFLGSRLVEKMSTIKGLEILATGRILKAKNSSQKPNVKYVLGNLEDTKFVQKISTNTIKDLKRTYYLFEGRIK